MSVLLYNILQHRVFFINAKLIFIKGTLIFKIERGVMRDTRKCSAFIFTGNFFLAASCMSTQEIRKAELNEAEKTIAIEATAQVSDVHPEMEEGITCADCHEVPVDATTRTTETWLHRDYLNFSAGEGLESNEDTKKHILSILGERKKRTLIY